MEKNNHLSNYLREHTGRILRLGAAGTACITLLGACDNALPAPNPTPSPTIDCTYLGTPLEITRKGNNPSDNHVLLIDIRCQQVSGIGYEDVFTPSFSYHNGTDTTPLYPLVYQPLDTSGPGIPEDVSLRVITPTDGPVCFDTKINSHTGKLLSQPTFTLNCKNGMLSERRNKVLRTRVSHDVNSTLRRLNTL